MQMKSSLFFIIRFFGATLISNQLFSSSSDDIDISKTAKSKNAKSMPTLRLHEKNVIFFDKLYSKSYHSKEDSLEGIDSADSDEIEEDLIREESFSDNTCSFNDSDFFHESESKDVLPDISIISLHKKQKFCHPQKSKKEEKVNIFKNPHPVSDLFDSQEILYIKFVMHLFKIREYEEINKKFEEKIPEISPPSMEDSIEKNIRGCLKEEIDIYICNLQKKLKNAPKFLIKTMEVLNNPLCFIPIREEIYNTFIVEVRKIKLSSVFPPSFHLEFSSDISLDIGLKFYKINNMSYMTLKKSNIKGCDFLLKHWNQKENKSLQKNCFKIIYLSEEKKRKDFLKNNEFDEVLRKSLVE